MLSVSVCLPVAASLKPPFCSDEMVQPTLFFDTNHNTHTHNNTTRTTQNTGMLALRRVGTALRGLPRLPASSSIRPAIMTTLPLPASQTRGVKSSRNINSSTSTTTSTRKRKGRDTAAPINAAFFKVDGATPPAHHVEGADAGAEGEGWVVGEVTDHAIDLHDVRPVRNRCLRKKTRKRRKKATLWLFFLNETWILTLLISLPSLPSFS